MRLAKQSDGTMAALLLLTARAGGGNHITPLTLASVTVFCHVGDSALFAARLRSASVVHGCF